MDYTPKLGIDYYGQLAQDLFVTSVLGGKSGGAFLEIGASDPINISNTYILETKYAWRGIMVERDPSWLPKYQLSRSNSKHIIGDATSLDYALILRDSDFPERVDYLQIDLEVNNRSTLTTLEKVEKELMQDYRFSVITFEHDIYAGDHFETRSRSRDILSSNGYHRVYSDVGNIPFAPANMTLYKFEDWYVCPDAVDMSYIESISRDDIFNFEELLPLWRLPQ
jgi:hypothetical protein